MIAIAGAIVVSVALGVAAERRWGERSLAAAQRAMTLMLMVLLPPVAFVNVARLEVSVDVGASLALGWVALVLAGLVAWAVARYVLALDRPATGSLIVCAVQANTGYLGLPLSVAVLGPDELGRAVAYDQLVTTPFFLLVAMGVAAAFGTRAGTGARQRVRAFLTRNPPLYAALLGFLAPDALAPDALVDASRVLVVALLPVGFVTLGVVLAAEAEEGALRIPPRLSRAVGAGLGLRLLVAPALLVALTLPFDLPAAFLLLAAMPAGVNGLVAAHAFGLDLGLTAGTIAWSTVLVVLAALVLSL